MKTLLLVSLLFAISSVAFGQVTITRINPVVDGDIYGLAPSPNVVSTSGYVLAAGYIRGAMVFSAFDATGFDTVNLALNPYGLPIWDGSVDVYGYDLVTGMIQPSDYNKGSFVGTLNISPTVGFGQDSFLDVTSFVKGSHPGGYFGFILVTTGTDVFSSLEYNYGNPSGLVATSSVPEPATNALILGAAAGVLLIVKRRKLASKRSSPLPV